MRRLLQIADTVLRGGFSDPAGLRSGQVGGRTASIAAASILLGSAYGLFMGLHSALRTGGAAPGLLQLVSTVVKVPLLFLLTLAVTYPSLYVFSTIAGSPLRFAETARLLLMGILVNLALLASLGPVTGFFTLSTESYRFMIVLNVLFFGLSGFAGVVFVAKALRAAYSPGGSPTNRAGIVLQVWILIYATVGAQMGWILRPFVGSPELGFSIFRQRESNFFQALFRTIKQILISS